MKGIRRLCAALLVLLIYSVFATIQMSNLRQQLRESEGRRAVLRHDLAALRQHFALTLLSVRPSDPDIFRQGLNALEAGERDIITSDSCNSHINRVSYVTPDRFH